MAQSPGGLGGLKWRNIGPFRAGRVSAVAGIPGNPAVFYMGLPNGGVWKTTSAGQTWFPVFDTVEATSAIGAIQVAPSNPSIVYAGTGEISGGSEGAGVYRSDDAGATWKLLGLEGTKVIPTILVDPKDPDTVLLAATGSGRKPGDERGVYRTTDGGKSWTKTLFVDNQIGIQHLARAYDKPSVVFALSQRWYRDPASFRPGAKVPSGTAIYRSADEGQTWKKLTPTGLPEINGRCTIAVAQGTDSQRVYLIGTFGLYRSDDGGNSWRRMAADDARIANGQGNYTSGVYVDPKNPDIVYTLATCDYRSVDGGNTFEAFKGAPGGDDPQQLWIDPTDGTHQLLGGDQGAMVTLDGGATWGSWYNQPTGQFYHIGVDNQWPYWVYGTQQDSGAIGTSSRGNLGQILPTDWTPHPGSEFGPMVIDPLDPNISYCFGTGGLLRVMFPSGQWTPINPPVAPGEELRGPNAIVFSAGDPHELLAGAQYLLSSKDRGATWHPLSPDLTLHGTPKPKDPKPTFSIGTISASRLDPRIIWVGTGSGLIQLTRDHGKSWQEVTPPKMAGSERSSVSWIEAAGTNKSAAYAVITWRTGSERKPRVYRTNDFGHTWTEIMSGLPVDPEQSGPFVLRSDTKRSGLLFITAGSDVFYSVNDGDRWEPLTLNLPNTPPSDMLLHGDDLILATFGRGIWILDDFSPLREISPATSAEPVHLFKPATAIRVRRNPGQDTPFPPEVPHAANPPVGASIDYSLAAKPNGLVALEILDSAGHVVRHMSSAPIPPYTDPKPAVPDFWFEPRNPMPTDLGLNRVNWNLRYDSPPAFFHDPSYTTGADEHHTPFANEGPLAVPGTYTARLTVDGKTYTQPITVVNDPRSPGTQRGMEALHEIQMRLYAGIQEAWDGYQQVTALRAAVAKVVAGNPGDEVSKAAKAFDDKLAAIGGSTVRHGILFIPESTTDFVGMDQHLISALNDLDFGDVGPTESVERNSAAAWLSLKELTDKWRGLNQKELSEFNSLLAKHNLSPIPPAPPLIDPPSPSKRYLPPVPAKKGH
ncbi:hypothetical protein OP10G_2490 [Fimbriimonas ginsengisoli Gsoil 348]|uniref:Sortilin N-terminal domain-containing protein n=2 Tax=Fimbriimonas ginsengisoli TaxID=1005039 RepID=A0A068NQM1_FIMGI|nr:hypothetical protein OP10G_2490 [Fimbriimonas ginsengisoli Gsoil 348]